VAVDARQNLCRPRIDPVDRSGGHRTVALVAQLVDVGNVQQPGILRSVRAVARQTAFSLDCGMFEHEGSACLCMALGADRILICCGFDVVVAEGAVNVMAVAALHQAFIHLVVEGLIERRLDIGVTLEAQLRLRCLQQTLFRSGTMYAVAAEAAHAGLRMRRAIKVGVCSRMATEACSIHLLRRGLAQLQNLGNVSATFHVRATWTVAALTGGACAAMHQHNLRVRIVSKVLGDICMAQRARIGSHIVRRIRRARQVRRARLLGKGRHSQKQHRQQHQAS